MNIYDLVNEIESAQLDYHWDNYSYYFNLTNRAKLDDRSDLDIFELFMKAFSIKIIYREDQRNQISNLEYRKYDNEELITFTDIELHRLYGLDWENLSHNLKAHIYDAIWLCNKDYEAAKIAADEYFALYIKWFHKEYWAQCIDYINRCIELVAKIGSNDKKDIFLNRVYNDVIQLNGDDSYFLSISLIELLIKQNYSCDFNTLIPLLDKIIFKNEYKIETTLIVEKAYYVKAKLYKKLKDRLSENKVYLDYADALMTTAEMLVNSSESESVFTNQNLFRAENFIKQAIKLFQNHSESEKATNAQKRLLEIQKNKISSMPMHEFKYDVSDLYIIFSTEYKEHDIRELIWDAIFAFDFQKKQKIRDSIIKDSFPLSSMFPLQVIGAEGQTEFFLPSLDLNDENNILLHMYHQAKEYECIQGETIGLWFIQYFKQKNLQESDLDMIFENNPIIPKGQEKDIQRGIYYGLTGHMSDSLDKLAPKVENIIRNLAEMCGDLMTYYDSKEGIQQKKVLSQVFNGEKLNECIEEDILFTFDGLLQQKAGSNIRNKIGHGLNTEADCCTGDCIYFVMIVLKFCSLYCKSFINEIRKRKQSNSVNDCVNNSV